MMASAAIVALGGCMFAGTGGNKPAPPPAAAPASVAQPAPPPPADPQPERLEFHATLAANAPVVIDNPYGDVRLRFGGYTHAVEVQAVVQTPRGAHAIALEPHLDNGRYAVLPRLPAGETVAPGQRVDVVVFVPLGHDVAAHTEQGEIESHGIRGNVDLRSTAGNIAVRGTQGAVQAQTGAGTIEASLNAAPRKSHQHLATSTGQIVVGVGDKLDAEVELATSSLFATEYSLRVEHLQGQEPNKRAHTVIGAPRAHLSVESRRGEIRLLRRAEFASLNGKRADEEHEDNDSD